MCKKIIKKILSHNQKLFFKKIISKILFLTPALHSLNMLALKYQTDKYGHDYLKYYEKYFSLIRKKKLNILEIGVGGYDNPTSGGSSLRMWQEYFPNSMIYSIDIYDKKFHEDQRIKIYKGSQNDPDFLKKIASEIAKIDIIIDDGSHINEHVITSFRTLFPFLNDNGMYIIEDLQTAYVPEFGGNCFNLNNSVTSISMLKNLIDGIYYQYIPDRKNSSFDENISSVHFYPKIAFIFKHKNTLILSEDEIQSFNRSKSLIK